jgi:hypothetical protein
LLAVSGLVIALFLSAQLRPAQNLFGAVLGDRLDGEHNGPSLALAMLLLVVVVIGWAYFRLRPRTARGWAGFSLAGATITIGALVVLQSAALALLVTAGALVILPTLIALAEVGRRLTSWRRIGAGYLLLAPVLVYLAADDDVIRRPMTMEEIAPGFPGAEQSHAVLLRYGKDHPLGRDFRAPQRMFEGLAAGQSIDTSDPVKWQAWLTGHRADIEAMWAEIAPVRAWWAELNAFDRIGDLTPPRADAEIITFAPPRILTQLGCAMAGLQALDGHGDEAIDTLLPLLQVSRKLQPSGRTLVRVMVAIVIERMALQTAGFILDHATVSPAARARLLTALSASGGGAAGARRLIAVEYVFVLNMAADKSLGALVNATRLQPSLSSSLFFRRGLDAVSPFVYNRRATFNFYGDFVADEQELVANRQFDGLKARTDRFMAEVKQGRFKNFAGMVVLQLMTPALSKVAESYWKTQDLRAALLARLEKT